MDETAREANHGDDAKENSLFLRKNTPMYRRIAN